MDTEEVLELDIKELEKLISISERENIRNLLISYKESLEKQRKPSPVVEEQKTEPQVQYKPIDKFAWEQTSSQVKVYVTHLQGLKNLPKENIGLDYTPQSIDLKIRDLSGSNYRLRFKKLAKEITEATIRPKSEGFSLSLKKKEPGNWESLEFKESAAPKPKVAEDQDPSAGLMNMMKELYQSGDEDMKRTIAEAWTKAQEGKQ